VGGDPESGTINYRYDAAGNMVWRDDNMGRQTCYSYDALNRVTQKIYFTGNYATQGGNCAAVPGSAYLADSPTVSYSYDSANISYGIGRLAKVTNGISTTTILSYDAEGRTLASQQSTAGKTYNLFYGYDLSGALTSETYPSGRQIATQFDGAGREKKIDGALGGQPSAYLSSVAYAPHGGVGSMQYGNNVWHEVNYNSRLQPYQALDVINNDPNQLLRAECLYWSGSYNLTACGAENHTDNNGNPRATVFWYGNGGTSVSASFNETFAYDGVNRLTGVVDNGGWSRYFAYDQYSNMWLCGWPGIAPNGSAPAASYCSQTPSALFNNANQIVGRSYDGAGNMASLMGSNFTYDAENRITTAVQPGIGTVTYTYDGDGRRVMKAVSTGLQTVYVYDIGGKLVAEYSSGAASVPPCHTCFLSSDHLGSTRLVTDENGNTVSRHDYIPFGEEIAANSGGRDGTFGAQDFVNQKFTGKERDQETGLDYFGARYFGSALGRFTSPDPLMASAHASNPQSWNRYAYALNNPLRFVDPDGMDVPAACAQDKNCQIVVKVNVIYDKTVNNGKGFTDAQKKAFEKDQIAKAQKDFGNSNIKLDVTYTQGSYTVDSNGKTQISGLDKGALNIVASTAVPDEARGANGFSGQDNSTAITFLRINDLSNTNWFASSATTEHELGHQFLGDPFNTNRNFFTNIMRDTDIDARNTFQSLGVSQSGYRQGLEPRRYAVPANPEANKPQK
jgi:RHS repeat-associated protein